ncbi:MAG: hypothetical protein M3Q50_07305 [Chloroflexota bacterium]|nr:hypothetical protein [Chloroflexota bacterium]
MTDPYDVDRAQAAQITERIGQTFDFVRDAIDDPRILALIPSGSTVMFRDGMHQGRQIRLIAYRPKQPSARWGAEVSEAALSAVADSSQIPETEPLRRGRRWPCVEGYLTAAAALDALEAKLRDAERPGWASRHAVGE